MSRVSKHPVETSVESKVYKVFMESIKNANDTTDVVNFLNDLLSPAERIMLSKRVVSALLLLRGDFTYEQIAKKIRVSRGTIAKINTTLVFQGQGYRKIIGDMLKRKALKIVLGELLEGLTPLSPKWANRGEWKKARLKAKWKREEPF